MVIALDGRGEPMLVAGRVLGADGTGHGSDGGRVAGDEDGFYDAQQPGIQPELNLRGPFPGRRGFSEVLVVGVGRAVQQRSGMA